MKKLKKIINCRAQASVEFILFVLLVTCVSLGMLKIFALSWKHKFEFLSVSKEILNALF